MTRYLEILGRSVTVPDPDSVASLATGYGAVGSGIGHAKDQLTGLSSMESWAQWRGQSADEFAGKLGDLPRQLGQALDSYNTAAWALSEYASGLGPVVAALVALSYQAEEAEGTLRATQAARDQVIQQGHDPAATGWDARLGDAETTVSELGGRLSSLLDQLESLSSQCVARIQQAQHEGIQNNLVNDFQRYVVQDVAEPYIHLQMLELRLAGDIAVALFVDPVTGFAKDLVAFAEHPSWETFGKTLDDASAVLAIAALVVAVIPGVDVVATPLLLAASRVLAAGGMAADFVAAEKHEPGASWTRVGEDGLSLGLSSVSGILSHGAAAGQDAFAVGNRAQESGGALWSTGVKRFAGSWGLDSGWTPPAEVNPEDSWLTQLGKNVQGEVSTFAHFGYDGKANCPAGVTFQHVGFGVDRLNDASTVIQDRYPPKGQGS